MGVDHPMHALVRIPAGRFKAKENVKGERVRLPHALHAASLKGICPQQPRNSGQLRACDFFV